MKFNVRVGTLSKMMELCKKHKEGNLKESELLEVLSHEDYDLEFRRYGQKGLPMSTIEKEEFVDFFMNINDVNKEDIKNPRLKMRYDNLIELFNNFEHCQKTINKINSFDTDIYEEAIKYTLSGLPDDFKNQNVDVVFTISIGNSCGWEYDNCIHFDAVALEKMIDLNNLDEFKAYIAHEIHHIFIARYLYAQEEKNLSYEEKFYNFFSYEGLAVKYCNNSQGPLTNKIYDIESNIGMAKSTWNYFERTFDDMYNEFKKNIHMIRDNEIDSDEKYNKMIMDYWMTPFVKDENGESIELAHYRNYYLGTNIWGLIHDVYGKKKLYETFNNPKHFPKVLNDALIKIGREDLVI